jgi:hypothetical protein
MRVALVAVAILLGTLAVTTMVDGLVYLAVALGTSAFVVSKAAIEVKP